MIYKEVLSQMRNGNPGSSKECPLNSKNLGIISEMDHLNRKCLCPICTCGKHVCPSSAIPDPYPVSTFKSSYMANFQGSSPLRSQVPQNRGNFLPSVSFDYETTNAEAFKPHSINPASNNFRTQTSSPPKTPFISQSIYNSNYQNWGVGLNQVVKPGHQKHTAENLKLKAKSSYQVNFSPPDEDELKLLHQEKVNAKHKTHIDPQAKFNKVTTSRKEFIDYTKKAVREKGYKPEAQVPRMKSVDNHYVTTNRKDYISFTGEPDSRYLRKIIEKEGLMHS